MELRRIELDAMCGENIKEYAIRAIICLATKQKKYTNFEFYIVCNFNGVKIIVTKLSTVDSIINDYQARLDDNAYEYRQTDEYKEIEEKKEQEIKKLNRDAQIMLCKFEKLNKRNKLALINWLAEFQPVSDHVGVVCDKSLVVSELHKAGYVADMNCNINHTEPQTADEYANWIIGQCLAGLESIGAIHQMIPEFADRYRHLLTLDYEKLSGLWVAFKAPSMKPVLHGRVLKAYVNRNVYFRNGYLIVKCKNGCRRYVDMDEVIQFCDSKEECYKIK